jgi:hypothetical protein
VSPPPVETLDAYGYVSPDNKTFHTYVLGMANGIQVRDYICRGLATGGRFLCGGQGSIALADCIYDIDLAGIYYAQTGVCHQIANRVLAAAGDITIHPAEHWHVRSTYLAFGKFGRNFRIVFGVPIPVPPDRCWPQRKLRCEVQRSSNLVEEEDSGIMHLSTGIGNEMVRVAAHYEPDPKAELSELIECGLGHSVSDAKIAGLLEMQERLRYRIGSAAGLLAGRKIDKKHYLRLLDIALSEASETGTELIGEEEFHQVFGPMTAETLIDPNVLFSEED